MRGLVLLLLVAVASARVFERCEWAHILKNAGMDGYEGNSLADYLLTDDVDTAITCAKRVVRDPNGIRAWVAWRVHCEGQDLTPYLEGCGL
ncbi:lysozyme C%2C partial [Xyrichtys novacula]|uniref:lysozyme n=1 Tax=Xyrichtys novacula TaxID=13765 RepID=A0AAV1GD40_XYRNO|nr:lysozyme C%2C partial [Xyrichtys novacula]